MILSILYLIRFIIVVISVTGGYIMNDVIKYDMIMRAKLCKICYSRTALFNISRNKMLRKYNDYLLINDTATRTISYIFYNNNQIDICFKGTSNIRDNLFNFNIYPESYIATNIKVHRGFLFKYLAIRPILIEHIHTIMNKHNIQSISCNGHSSGGAMANIAAVDLYHELHMKINCITFGSPRIGNQAFTDLYHKCVNKSMRIVNWNDIIQYVPPHVPYIYQHIQPALLLKERIHEKNMNVYKYFKKSHSITQYIKNIINCN